MKICTMLDWFRRSGCLTRCTASFGTTPNRGASPMRVSAASIGLSSFPLSDPARWPRARGQAYPNPGARVRAARGRELRAAKNAIFHVQFSYIEFEARVWVWSMTTCAPLPRQPAPAPLACTQTNACVPIPRPSLDVRRCTERCNVNLQKLPPAVHRARGRSSRTSSPSRPLPKLSLPSVRSYRPPGRF